MEKKKLLVCFLNISLKDQLMIWKLILVVSSSEKIQVLYFSFDSLHFRNEREIVEDLSNRKHKKFTVFTILKK